MAHRLKPGGIGSSGCDAGSARQGGTTGRCGGGFPRGHWLDSLAGRTHQLPSWDSTCARSVGRGGLYSSIGRGTNDDSRASPGSTGVNESSYANPAFWAITRRRGTRKQTTNQSGIAEERGLRESGRISRANVLFILGKLHK